MTIQEKLSAVQKMADFCYSCNACSTVCPTSLVGLFNPRTWMRKLIDVDINNYESVIEDGELFNCLAYHWEWSSDSERKDERTQWSSRRGRKNRVFRLVEIHWKSYHEGMTRGTSATKEVTNWSLWAKKQLRGSLGTSLVFQFLSPSIHKFDEFLLRI